MSVSKLCYINPALSKLCWFIDCNIYQLSAGGFTRSSPLKCTQSGILTFKLGRAIWADPTNPCPLSVGVGHPSYLPWRPRCKRAVPPVSHVPPVICYVSTKCCIIGRHRLLHMYTWSNGTLNPEAYCPQPPNCWTFGGAYIPLTNKK